jgi:aminoglycoside 6'-N-acetyltransferase I
MRVRPIEPRDRPAWASMRAALWPDEDADLLAHETMRHFAGAEAAGAVFVAENADDQLVGFLELGLRTFAEGCSSSPVPFVEGWYVAAQARTQGVGRALMQAGEGWALTRGFSELASDTELTNGLSQEAHRALGFAETERLVAYRKALRL